MSDLTPEELPVATEPQEAPRGALARIFGALFSPVRTFRDIAKRPDWLVPMALIFVIALGSVAVTVPRLDYDAMREKMEAQQKKNPNLTAEQQEKAMKIGVAFAKGIMWLSPFFALGWLAILGAIYMLGIRLAGGEGSYAASLAIMLYAQMPLVIRRILNDGILLTKKAVDPEKAQMLLRSNLAFLTDMKTNPAGWASLAALDVFAIWSVILMIIGFAELPRMTRGRSAAVVITIWLIFALFGVGAASFAVLMRRGA